METTTSADGTTIAFARAGDGAAVVVVGGAFSTAAAGAGLAGALADAGFCGVTYDRRARGGSGDTPPYAPAREADDLAAVIATVGGCAGVLGHSSGGVLALLAAASGVPVGHLFCSEPPFGFGDDEAPSDLPERLQGMVDEGRPGDAVVAFQREAVRLPDAVIEQIRTGPMFAELVPLAQSAVYDATLTREVSTPTAAMLAVPAPVTVLLGSQTFPMLDRAARRLADEIPHAELVVVPESVGHRPDPAATARVVVDRLRPGERG